MVTVNTLRALVRGTISQRISELRSTAVIRKSPPVANLVKKGFLFPALSDEEHVKLILDWLEWATSNTSDSGVPQHINLRKYAENGVLRLAPSYPETTGYILCSLIFGLRHGLASLTRQKLDRMTSYLLSVQNRDGSVPGVGEDFGSLARRIPRPGEEIRGLAFDTGQVLTGLVAYYRHLEARADVADAIERAADWMSARIEADGAYAMSSCYNGARAYYIRATIGLVEAAKAFGREDWLHAARRNAEWTFRQRSGPAWFRTFSFEDHEFQNLHGIAYTLRGLIALGRNLGELKYVAVSKACIDRLLDRSFPDLPVPDAIPGHFADSFRKYRRTVSPTGMCQLALSAFLLAKIYGDSRYAKYGASLIDSVKRFHIRGLTERGLNGLLPGSWPVTGPYMHAVLPNWPIKFFLDGLYIKQGADPLALEG
jgi:hypothetical protein